MCLFTPPAFAGYSYCLPPSCVFVHVLLNSGDVVVCAMFARRRQLSTRSQTTDGLLQKSSDDSQPQSVVLYDHVTLCQRHRQQHLHQYQCQQQQQHCTSPLNPFPLLLHPCEHLTAETVARSTVGRTGDMPLPPRPGHPPRSAPAFGNSVLSSMTSFSLECDGGSDVNAGDTGVVEDTLTSVM